MKKLAILTLGVSLALAVPVAAQEGSVGSVSLGSIDANQDGRVSRDEFSQFATYAFDEMDNDNSQTLSADEIDDHLVGESFRELDADGNNAVTKAEFGAQMSKDFDAADRDGNGFID